MVLGCFASYSLLFTRYRWSQIPKIEGFYGRGGERERNKSCASKLWEGPERRANVERVEAYCQIESDRHLPDCKAIGSLTFDR